MHIHIYTKIYAHMHKIIYMHQHTYTGHVLEQQTCHIYVCVYKRYSKGKQWIFSE